MPNITRYSRAKQYNWHMNSHFQFSLVLVLSQLLPVAHAAEPTPEEILQPTRLSLITAGSDLKSVFADVEKQTGNKLVDETARFRDAGEPLSWNFSLSDREFWPLMDKFFDAALLEPLNDSSADGFPVGRRYEGMTPRFGDAIYVGPFRLEVTQVSSHLDNRVIGDHRATVELEIAWEPRLHPLMFSQAIGDLKLMADEKTPISVPESHGELSVEVPTESHAVKLQIPLQLQGQQVGAISSLKGRIKTLVATNTPEFRFDKLDKAKNVTQTDGGVTVVLEQVRENQGLCELHMRVEFDEKLPAQVAQGSWNFQNPTYLENAAGEKLEHAGFESTMQTTRKLGLAYYFDVPAEILAEYTWVYSTPAAIVEVPIEFELKNVALP